MKNKINKIKLKLKSTRAEAWVDNLGKGCKNI